MPYLHAAVKKDEDYKGQYITIYLTDNVYDLDPAKAYKNEALAKVVGLMFDTLFTLDEKGKVKKSLVKEYWTESNSLSIVTLLYQSPFAASGM